MSDDRKTITEFKAQEWRQERAEKRRAFYKRLWRIFKSVLVIAIFVVALHDRARIQRFCYAAFDRVMNHITLSSQTREKAADYQQQIDGVTTN